MSTNTASDVASPDRPLVGRLPDRKRAYALRDGDGEHHLVGGQVATLLARAADTGGEFEAAILTGGREARIPPHRHAATHEALLVLDGQVDLDLGGTTHLLTRGDYASIPPGTVHAHRMRSHRTRLLSVTVGGPVAALYPALGTPAARPVQPEAVDPAIGAEASARAEAAADVAFLPDAAPAGEPRPVDGAALPDAASPYLLRSGEGERLVAADQMFTLLGTRATSGGDLLVVMTEGPAGNPIPPHFHERHTENFMCLDGLMTMWIDGEELRLAPGDYLHVPPGTVHSYRLDAPYTRFVGWLAPGLFEPFFRLIGDLYAPHVFPLTPPPFRFDRVLARLDDLDLRLLGRPGGSAPR